MFVSGTVLGSWCGGNVLTKDVSEGCGVERAARGCNIKWPILVVAHAQKMGHLILHPLGQEA